MTGKIKKGLKLSKPIRMWIDGKCFNINRFQNKPIKAIPMDESKLEDVSKMVFPRDEANNFYTSFELPKFYYQKLQSQTNYDLKTLSERTKTQIVIPQQGEEGQIKITGSNEEDLKEALNEIHSVIGFIREKNIALQFSTIPLVSEEIKTNFEKFKNDVLADEELEDIDETLFIKKEKLHLTINVFVLHNERELQEATSALNDFKNNYLVPLLEKTGPLKILVKGLNCMDEDLKKVNVLYANAKLLEDCEHTSLQAIADSLSNYFYERGLLKNHQECVKIHMTLMNSKYRKVPGSRKKRKRQSIDASKIMEKYGSYEFGTCDFNNIRIAHIFANPNSEDGFYKTLSEIKL